MTKNVKMKDIAEKANVSIATVSYILNDVKSQSISEETRNRVLQISKEFGYVPNLTARSLASKKSGLIGIMIVKDSKQQIPWKDILYGKFIHEVERLLAKEGYHILVTSVDAVKPELDIILQRELDGVFLLDIREDMFYEISRKFYVPIIIVDSFLDDTYFHKIVPDMDKAIEKAKEQLDGECAFLIADQVNNSGIMQRIREAAQVREENLCFAKSEDEIRAFSMKHRMEKGIAVGEEIALQAFRYLNLEDLSVVCTYGCPFLLPPGMNLVTFDTQKAEIAVDIMLSYIQGHFASSDNKYTYITTG